MRHAIASAARARQVANGARYGALAGLCHELRTPLNAIFGFAEMLDDPRFSVEERREFTQRIKTAGGDLLHVIERSLEEAERPLLGRLGAVSGERARRIRWSLDVAPNEQLPWLSPVRRGRLRDPMLALVIAAAIIVPSLQTVITSRDALASPANVACGHEAAPEA